MRKLSLILFFSTVPMISQAAFMDADWAKQACDGWNGSEKLTNELGGEIWAANDGGRDSNA